MCLVFHNQDACFAPSLLCFRSVVRHRNSLNTIQNVCKKPRFTVSVIVLLNLLPLGGGRTDLQAGEKHLVAVLPHDEGPDDADQRLGGVEHDLDQEVKSEGPRYGLAVFHALVGEGASYRVLLAERANTVPPRRPAAEPAGLRVMVPGKGHHQHRNDQPDGAQDKVQNLEGRDGKLKAFFIFLSLSSESLLTPAAVL